MKSAIAVLLLLAWGPAQADDWNWQYLGAPMGDKEVGRFHVDPVDDTTWYVESWRGIYITRNNGRTWERHLSGYCPALEFDPQAPATLYVGSENRLYRSENRGMTWEPVERFEHHIQAIHVSEVDGSIYAGVRWEDSKTANGMYVSRDRGRSWTLYPYGVTQSGLIPWDIAEDAVNEKLYVATEIYDHPGLNGKPGVYDPPFLRSSDGGRTWDDVSGHDGGERGNRRGTLPWHLVAIQVHPVTHNVYALTEGSGLYQSSDFGDTWRFLSNVFVHDFLIDPRYPNCFYGSPGVSWDWEWKGIGVFVSTDAGSSFDPTGFPRRATALCLNNESSLLYACVYDVGIYKVKIPRGLARMSSRRHRL
jgi:photosystem II stability/assembly factor-like uncharacterized protein